MPRIKEELQVRLAGIPMHGRGPLSGQSGPETFQSLPSPFANPFSGALRGASILHAAARGEKSGLVRQIFFAVESADVGAKNVLVLRNRERRFRQRIVKAARLVVFGKVWRVDESWRSAGICD